MQFKVWYVTNFKLFITTKIVVKNINLYAKYYALHRKITKKLLLLKDIKKFK